MNADNARHRREGSKAAVAAPRYHVLLALVVSLGASFADAQLQAPQLTPNYRDADIRLVAEQLQQVLGRPIVMDARVRAQLTMSSSAPMSPDAFYRLFLTAIETHGYLAVEVGNTIQIVPKENRE